MSVATVSTAPPLVKHASVQTLTNASHATLPIYCTTVSVYRYAQWEPISIQPKAPVYPVWQIVRAAIPVYCVSAASHTYSSLMGIAFLGVH